MRTDNRDSRYSLTVQGRSLVPGGSPAGAVRCAAQVAVSQAGRLVGFETFGRVTVAGVERVATNETVFTVCSCMKVVTSSAAWILLQERRIRLGDSVADHIPDFGTNGKGPSRRASSHALRGVPKHLTPTSVVRGRGCGTV